MIPKDSETALRLRRAFPRGLLAPVDETVAIIPAATLEPTRHDIGPVRVGNEPLHIPSRVYFPEPDLELVAKLGEIQRIILGCIYTRHHDGFVRERYLANVLTSTETWIPPFVLQLVGEYVIDIIQRIMDRVDDLPHEVYARFGTANSEFLNLTRQRVVSYWYYYHRFPCPRLIMYPGFQLLEALGLWGGHSPRLLAAP